MSRSWNTFEGLSVGAWRLESFLGERDDRAFFTARNPARDTPALVELVDADAPGAFARAASWREAARLSHPALLAVHDIGEAELDGVPVAYAALDLPHDDLSEAVTRRLFSAEEARSTFAPVASALDYLHARGLRHNAVTPENVFLVGDQVKLGIDAVTPASGGAESDLRQFGSTLVYAMTGKAVNDADPRKTEATAGLPPPFNEIAAGCLNGLPDPNWNARRVADILSSRTVEPPRGRPGEPEAEVRRARRRMTPAVIGAVAVGVIVAYVFSGRHSQPPAETHAAKPASPAPHRAPARPSERAEADRVVERPSAPPRAAATGPKASWAVIAATYSSFSAAEKRAEALRKLSSRLRPHVFPREGEGRRYYVVLGSSLTQDAAQRLRALATSLGAPKDTYVTKLDES